MMYYGCCQSIPTLGVASVTLTGKVAVLNLTSPIPSCGKFNVRVCGRCLDVCSARPVILKDCAGTSLDKILDKCGNPVLLNKVAVQARRHAVLHFCRSIADDLVILQDTICAPTPVSVEEPAAAPSKPSTDSGSGSDSSCDSGDCPSSDDIVPPGQYK